MALGFVIGLGAWALAVTSAVRWYLIGLPLGIVCFICGAKITPIAADVVKAIKIDHEHIWLEGVHPDLVAALPDFATRPTPRVEL
jgi:hypothetical protein